MKAMEKCINDTVQLLSEKYGFNKDEAHAYLGCDKRGRPEKKAKAKINKTEMVDDVIGRLLQMGSLTPPCELPMLNKVVQKKNKVAEEVVTEVTEVTEVTASSGSR